MDDSMMHEEMKNMMHEEMKVGGRATFFIPIAFLNEIAGECDFLHPKSQSVDKWLPLNGCLLCAIFANHEVYSGHGWCGKWFGQGSDD
jgi:hypothetical protein